VTATITARTTPRPPVRETPGRPAVAAGRPGWPVWLAAGLAVLLRLPFLGVLPGPDEGGFMALAAQWHPGSSLYGAYWVDRPPLLVTAFLAADHAGGLLALRLLGCVVVALTVVVVGITAQRLAGRGAATVAAVVAALLLASPLAGAGPVNGELLAMPFTAVGIALAVAALQPRTGRSPLASVPWAAAGAGACTAAAVLVKQNLADAAVFAAIAWVLACVTGRLRARRLLLLVAGAVAGAVALTAVVAIWTLTRGTSLGGVWFAMYPFRFHASHATGVLTSPTLQYRLVHLTELWLGSGVPLLMLALAWTVAGPRRRDPVAWALLGTLAFGMVSIMAGGSYWSHYLVELVVPVALGAGLAARARPRVTTGVVALVAVAAAVAWGHLLVSRTITPGAVAGRSISRVAHPRDTLVTVFGEANTLRAAGLHSPYPYLWSLPARTLDPHAALLRSVLRGTHAPTWLVASGHVEVRRLRHGLLGPVVRADFHRVAHVCGRTIYLHDGVSRATPAAGPCAAPSPLTWMGHQWERQWGRQS